MNYIIWKGINSNTLKGLLISELPPITKPKMRVQETTVDGVDGSLIEELGYETYTKTLKIGLTRDFDIDAVIKYFTGEGEVVFSNEPNKYYKARIIEQIDYQRLARFRTAEIKFKVQPFKYEYQEEKTSLETESIEGTTIMHTKNANTKIVKLGLEGNSTQKTRSGKNLFSLNKLNWSNGSNDPTLTITNNNSCIVSKTNPTSYSLTRAEINDLEVGKTYTASCINDNADYSGFSFDEYNSEGIRTKGSVETITIQEGYTYYIKIYLNKTSSDYTGDLSITYTNMQIEEGSSVSEFEEYGASPSPDYPSEIESIGYKNLFNKSITPKRVSGSTYEELETGFRVTVTTVGKYKHIGILIPNSDYLLGKEVTLSANINVSGINDGLARLYFTDDAGSVVQIISSITQTGSVVANIPSSYPEGATKIGLFLYANNTVEEPNVGDYVEYTNIQLVIGSTQKEYIEYGKYGINININNTTKTIILNEPLRSIPNRAKDTYENGKIIRRIGKVVLDGSENWSVYDEGMYAVFGLKISNYNRIYGTICMSNYYNAKENVVGLLYASAINNSICFRYNSSDDIENVYITDNRFKTVNEFKTFLAEQYENGTPVIVQYELSTQIVENLETTTKFELVEGTNNISNSENANMIVSYIDNKLIVNNLGNYTAKPIVTLKGVGTIEFILNDNTLFRYTFPENEDTVIIDSQKEDAYFGAELKNRNMTGEFPIFEIGENVITWNGTVENIEISEKSRWL